MSSKAELNELKHNMSLPWRHEQVTLRDDDK